MCQDGNDQLTESQVVTLMLEMKGHTIAISVLKGGITNTLYRVSDEQGGDYVFRRYSFREILKRNCLRFTGKTRTWSIIYMTELFKPFPDIYWFLWSLIQLNISKIEFDYYNYGKVKYNNAWKNIQYLREFYNLRI